MTVAVSAAASLFTVHSAAFTATASPSSRRGVGPVQGIEPVAASAAHFGAVPVLRSVAPGSYDAEGADPDLSGLALELSRRAAGMSRDIPCTLTVPPPVVH